MKDKFRPAGTTWRRNHLLVVCDFWSSRTTDHFKTCNIGCSVQTMVVCLRAHQPPTWTTDTRGHTSHEPRWCGGHSWDTKLQSWTSTTVAWLLPKGLWRQQTHQGQHCLHRNGYACSVLNKLLWRKITDLTTETTHTCMLDFTIPDKGVPWLHKESSSTPRKCLLRRDGCCLQPLAHCPDTNSKHLLSVLA